MLGEIKPTKIIYKPHCGKCGSLIDIREYGIAHQDIYEKLDGVMMARKVGTYIFPNKCAHCGVLFDSIEITPPKKYQDICIER